MKETLAIPNANKENVLRKNAENRLPYITQKFRKYTINQIVIIAEQFKIHRDKARKITITQ